MKIFYKLCKCNQSNLTPSTIDVDPTTLECDELNVIFELPMKQKMRESAIMNAKEFLVHLAQTEKTPCKSCLKMHITVADEGGLRHVVDGTCSTPECVEEGGKALDAEADTPTGL